MIRRVLAMRVGGYTVRRWIPTIVAVSVILMHAVGSPFWYRIASGTRISHTEVVSSSDMRDFTAYANLNSYDDEGASPIPIRGVIQRAIDAEHAGQSRAEARGAITLPVPTVFLELPELQIEGRPPLGHQFRCDQNREDCSIMLQSSAYFVHIVQGPDFISRVLVDRPLLAIRAESLGARLTGLRFPRPEIWRGGIARSTERFAPPTTRLAIAGGPNLDESAFNDTDLNLATFYKGVFLALPTFVAFDMDYTLDFRDPATNILESCQLYYDTTGTTGSSSLGRLDPCRFDTDEITVSTLAQCDAANGPCPSRATVPVDDLESHPFIRSGLTENISLEFLDDTTRTLFEMANRAVRVEQSGLADLQSLTQTADNTSIDLIDLPNRTQIARQIIIDYLTIAGFSTQSAEFEKLLSANPDLDINAVRTTFQQVSPTLINQAMLDALRRQPQLWVWHGYAEYIGPELLDGLARDLVKMGLARPY